MRRWCAHGAPPGSRLLPLRHSRRRVDSVEATGTRAALSGTGGAGLSVSRLDPRRDPLRPHLLSTAQDQSQSGVCVQKVGVKQTAEHIWLVSFMDYDLGYFDEDV